MKKVDEEQVSLFSMIYDEFKITKPIRLIELFAGYGSQSLALKYLDVNFEHWKIAEWAVKSIIAYKDLHFSENNQDYSKDLSFEEIVNYLNDLGISMDYNEPMNLKQIKSMGESKCRMVFNDIKASNNLVNISKVKGKDLNIVDTDQYQYILTYSFPCQDLSLAGLQKGMTKGSKTRNGLLWEVERILDELKQDNIQEMPILLMENVPEVHSKNNIKDFRLWIQKLESLGYINFCEDLNAKDFGVPQNRERCFMISILGDYFYDFPQKIPLELKLKDLLENKVDEKFYLSDKMIRYIQAKNDKWLGNNGNNSVINRNLACTKTTREGQTRADTSDYICDNLPNNYKLNQEIEPTMKMNEQLCDRLVESTNGICNTLTKRPDVLGIAVDDLTTKNKRLAQMINDKKIDIKKVQAIDIYNQTTHDEMHTIKTNIDKSNMTAVTQNLQIRKLTPKECFRLMGVKDEDFEKIKLNQFGQSLYHLAGDSIVTTCLMGLFGQLLGINWQDKFNIKEWFDY